MSNKIISNEENKITIAQERANVLPIRPLLQQSPIMYSIDTYTVNKNTGSVSTGDTANCDGDRIINCDISITPGAKFKSIKRVLLLLENSGGSESGFEVYESPRLAIADGNMFAYLDNRYDSNGNITYRVIDITNALDGCKSQTISLAIMSKIGNSCRVYTTGARLELKYLEDDDFIPNVSKLERGVGSKGAYSVNVRNGKLFYTQNLVQAKGGRMPFNLSMTYNAADCDTSSPNGIETGIKGWTFNYGQTLNTSTTPYTLLDGSHRYRSFKPSTNNSNIKYDASGKNGVFLMENDTGYSVLDGKAATYRFDADKRLTQIISAGGSTPITTSITYNADGKIATITDGMSDTYVFTYADNTITVSCGYTEFIRITLDNERVMQVLYLLPGETYDFTYDEDGQLLSVADSASKEKTVFEYSDASAVTAIKNYICKNSVSSPTDCYALDYRVLKTLVGKHRNTDNMNSIYSTIVYSFAESGETIFTCENGDYGAFRKMRFKSKNDYEKYTANLIDLCNAADETHFAQFSFENAYTKNYIKSSLTGNQLFSSDTLTFNTSSYRSNHFIFSGKIKIASNSYIQKDGQSIKLLLKEGNSVHCAIDVDPEKREYQVKSALIYLESGVHTFKAELHINEMQADIDLSEVFIFETDNGGKYEYIGDFESNSHITEQDNTKLWYINDGNLELSDGISSYTVKFTAKDHALTLLSRLKNPSCFNIWYNDGANMLAQVGDGWRLTKGGTTKNITEVRCCTVSRGINQKTFSYVEQSTLSGALIRAKNIIVTYKQAEDEDGDIYMDSNYFFKTVDYNTYMKPVQVNNEDGIITRYTYNEFGEVLTEKTYPENNSAMNILVSRAYSNGNLASITEKRYETDYTRSFAYNYDDTLSHETTPGGQQINHVYSADGEKLLCLASVIGESENLNALTYSGDLLNSLSHNDTAITFEYDERNNVENIKICGNSILSKEITYGAFSTESVTTYGNGAKIKKYYDKYNRLIKVTEIASDNTESQICAYIYCDTDVADTVTSPTHSSLKITASSKLYVFIDNVANTRTKYLYDEYGNLKKKQTGVIREKIDSRDEINRPTTTSFVIGTKALVNDIYYENHLSNRIEREVIYCGATATTVNYSRDALKRMHSVETKCGRNGYKRGYNYATRGETAYPVGTTNYVDRISYYNVVNNVATFEKAENIEYNADGNIVVYGENSYVYDGLGRLIRENNKALDKTFLFEYNVGGNIMYRSEFPYTTGAVGTVTKICDYYYNNAWKDQLTSYDNKAITYDSSGNPTSYMGKTLTWSRGRLLTKYVTSPLYSISMQYDANGCRTTKVKFAPIPFSDADPYTTTNYTYDSEGRIRCESDGIYTRYFIYGADGIVGYEENGVQFMYRKNLFGDITAIYNGKTKVAEYVYDAWGNCTITTNVNGYGTRNPIRYRGYYFDIDLNMYYLMTRYYDPQTGRFINADTPEYLDPKTINGLNLYAYCLNNPIMYVDPKGHNILAVLALIITIELMVLGMMVGYKIGKNSKEKVEGNIDMTYPGQVTDPNNDNTELTPEDRELNAIKGMLVGGYVGALSVAAIGAVLLFVDPAIGGTLFVAGSLGTILLKPFLKSVGFEVETPELDPSDIYQPDLPQYK